MELSNTRAAVWRLNSDGTLDASFGTGGKSSFDLSAGSDYAYGVALDGQGRAVMAGRAGSQAFVGRLKQVFDSDWESSHHYEAPDPLDPAQHHEDDFPHDHDLMHE